MDTLACDKKLDKLLFHAVGVLLLALFVAGCGSSSSRAACSGDSRWNANLYYVVGPAVETTQATGTVSITSNCTVFNIEMNGEGHSPSARLVGNGTLEMVNENPGSEEFTLNVTSWTAWEGTDDYQPTSLVERDPQNNTPSDPYDFKDMQFVDDPTESGYWLLIIGSKQ